MKTRGKVAWICAALAVPYLALAVAENDRRTQAHDSYIEDRRARAAALEPERCLWYLTHYHERKAELKGQDKHNYAECDRRLRRNYENLKTWHELQPQMR